MFTTYEIVCCFIGLCLMGIVALISWLLSFIFKKLNLAKISNFFDSLKCAVIIVLVILVGVFMTILIVIGFIFIVKYIANFIFALF